MKCGGRRKAVCPKPAGGAGGCGPSSRHERPCCAAAGCGCGRGAVPEAAAAQTEAQKRRAPPSKGSATARGRLGGPPRLPGLRAADAAAAIRAAPSGPWPLQKRQVAAALNTAAAVCELGSRRVSTSGIQRLRRLGSQVELLLAEPPGGRGRSISCHTETPSPPPSASLSALVGMGAAAGRREGERGR